MRPGWRASPPASVPASGAREPGAPPTGGQSGNYSPHQRPPTQSVRGGPVAGAFHGGGRGIPVLGVRYPKVQWQVVWGHASAVPPYIIWHGFGWTCPYYTIYLFRPKCPSHLRQRGFVAFGQFLDAPGQCLADALHPTVDGGLQRSQPFVVY